MPGQSSEVSDNKWKSCALHRYRKISGYALRSSRKKKSYLE